MNSPEPAIRLARLDEVSDLEGLIEASVRALCRDDYTETQVEAALGTAWGVDRQLIHDGTYFVVEVGNELAASGGWSHRQTLFGASTGSSADPERCEAESLDPAVDAARIRAFFVHPRFARRGLGRLLLDACEAAARRHGFRSAALVATLPGRRLYARAGYQDGEPFEHPLRDFLTITFVPMTKTLVP